MTVFESGRLMEHSLREGSLFVFDVRKYYIHIAAMADV